MTTTTNSLSVRPRVLLADDEPLLRAELREALNLLWPQAEIVGEANDGFQAFQMASTLHPDVAFLDIRMPGMSGIDIARTFGARVHVVFVTAFQDHAIAAFDEGALDYVLKPIDSVRLAKAIERIKMRLGTPPADLSRVMHTLAPKPAAPEWLQASIGSTIHFIDLKDVVYFTSDLKYTRVVTDTMQAHIRTPLKELAETLDNTAFWQIHRAYMVSVKRIAAATRDEDGAVWLKLKDHSTRLPVSQRFQHQFKGM